MKKWIMFLVALVLMSSFVMADATSAEEEAEMAEDVAGMAEDKVSEEDYSPEAEEINIEQDTSAEGEAYEPTLVEGKDYSQEGYSKTASEQRPSLQDSPEQRGSLQDRIEKLEKEVRLLKEALKNCGCDVKDESQITSSITNSECVSKTLKINAPIAFAGKKVQLKQVGRSEVVVEVNGISKIISTSSSEVVNGLDIKLLKTDKGRFIAVLCLKATDSISEKVSAKKQDSSNSIKTAPSPTIKPRISQESFFSRLSTRITGRFFSIWE